MEETPGQRLFKIRLACGDGHRDAEPLEEFAARVKRRTGKSYSAMTLSLLERMKQNWKLDDVDSFSAVDPLARGRTWLAWGDEPVKEPPADTRISDEDVEAARRVRDRKQLAEKAKGRKQSGGKG